MTASSHTEECSLLLEGVKRVRTAFQAGKGAQQGAVGRCLLVYICPPALGYAWRKMDYLAFKIKRQLSATFGPPASTALLVNARLCGVGVG
jgi:hypothetical protein